jgi:diguanylate cyclase (GGDEF)-like protein/PAS domain S-box-containing protein
VLDRVRGGARVGIGVPVRHPDGTVAGTLNGLIDLTGDEALARFAKPSNGAQSRSRLLVIDGEGLVIASDDPGLLLRPSVTVEALAAPLAAAGPAVRAPGGSGAELAGDQVLAWTPVPGTRWRVIALSPADALFESLHAMRDGALREAALGAGLAGVAMFGVAAWLLSPIGRLRDRALRLRDDPRAVAGGWPGGRDEIGELSRVMQDVMRARSAAETDARASLARVQAILDNVTVGVAVTRDASFEVVSPSFAGIVGFEIEDLIGRSASVLFPDRPSFERQRGSNAEAIGRDGRCDVETTMRHRDGRELRVRLVGSPLESHSRDAATIWVMEDVTARRAEQRQLRLSHELITRSHEALVVTDERDRVIVANPAFIALSGRDRDEVIGRPASAAGLAVPPRAEAPGQASAASARVETTVLRPDGGSVPCWASVSRVELDDERRLTLWMLADIGPLKAAQDELRRLALHDPLTGLPNRAAFRQQLDAAVHRARRNGDALALMFVDLDGFKAVNDAHGHEAGDALLRELSARLLATVRSGDTVCRLGGDEFTVIAEGLRPGASAPEIEAMCSRVVDELGRPVDLGGARAAVTASVGVSLYPEGAGSVDALVRDADAAMYRAKRAGKGRWHRDGAGATPRRPGVTLVRNARAAPADDAPAGRAAATRGSNGALDTSANSCGG